MALMQEQEANMAGVLSCSQVFTIEEAVGKQRTSVGPLVIEDPDCAFVQQEDGTRNQETLYRRTI